jgi:hypothetical protein
MARLRGIQATNMKTIAGSVAPLFPVVIMADTESVDAPFVIESVWLRVPSGVGQLTSTGAGTLCKTAAVRLDVTCRNIFRPAGTDLSVFSDTTTMDYSITIRWL